ncbi:hypothetical protein JTE90_027792 [Oedothorax gibbosus]|uniref:Gastric intrinsic factor n=1 Tax=Oedothorax gibbosus TaxID=931172 RepID=A0AAV6V623_9ARAC|nr:hypothetical protein JTE90_027792 [Oedothorax gibbosus]
MRLLIYLLFILGCQTVIIRSQSCKILNSNLSGSLGDVIENRGGRESRCWIIKVPKRKVIGITIESLMFQLESRNLHGLVIFEKRTGREYKIEKKSDVPIKELKFGSDVTITHLIGSHNYAFTSRIKLLYKFETGFFPVKFDNGVLDSGVSWLRNQSSDIMGWKDNTPRAVVALFLASAVTFDGNVTEEELMANQVELKTAVALMKSATSISELSMLVNALLVTCYNPRMFHGEDVVQRLKSLVTRSRDVVHPVAYLALCNANETWPDRATDDLDSVLNTTSNPQANQDMKAMAVMALSCYVYHRENNLPSNQSSETMRLYEDTIENFKALQFSDGSFGNVYTTALIAQAFVADMERDWNITTTAEYLMRELDSSPNFLTAYLVLPFLNGKSLVDVSYTNCSAHPRKLSDEIEDNKEVVTPIMQVKYSLFYGDKKRVIQSMYLGVPENSTAYHIMEQAEIDNPKYYTFKRKNIKGAINVFEMSGIPNDPENGNYWTMFVSPPKRPETVTYSDKSPDELIMKDAQHLVMWYRSHRF